MYDKFQGCTVDGQAATYLLPTLEQTLDYVHMLNVATTLFMMLVSWLEGFRQSE